MKLYATTTSERASKGQGGNEYLKIELLVGNAKEPASAGLIEVLPTGHNHFTVYYRYMGKSKELKTLDLSESVFAEKGNKQKVECVHCKAIQRVSPLNCFRHQ